MSRNQPAQHDNITAAHPSSQAAAATTSPCSSHLAASSIQSFSQSSATDSSQSATNTDANHLQAVPDQEMSQTRPIASSTHRLQQEINPSTSPSSVGSMSPSHAPKRTAAGIVKPPSPPASDVGVPSTTGVYRRKSTLDRSGRRISELSLQLKTKLTYAMIKVQNGWEHHSIDEVESLAATALASPISTTSTTMSHAPTFSSPRTTVLGANGRVRGSDASRDMVNAAHRSATTNSVRPSSGHSAWSHASPSLQSRDPRYTPQQYQQMQQMHQPRPLAPAVELRPKPRQYGYPQQHPSAHSTSGRSQDPSSLRATTPTPQEQDAVDTLLFMSSPANSQRFTHRPDPSISSTQNSPSRHNTFRIPRRSFGSSNMGPPTLYDRASASSEDGDTLMTPALSTSTSKRGSALLAPSGADERRAKRRSYGRLESEMDVDRLLDQMRDVASSDDEVEIPVPSRVAAGSKPVVVRM